ncbi:hypothetical protein [Endozoicomonas sp. GU-1]|uniref:hypothetical protein n=1 Tax=Endozoicomonas sp. GU-1 TaxID=3009078 RepID=UPI0022B5D931|nr:hypothetical protein [Endozoicomonas sp. GU-1]WBA83814.1 hypothetical protein O2T12_12190 [Endozoicomonas sp. GU-1]WBA86793.1 hypothetical protein O3276_01750 [Endozoicomonas sp. GU-1]
MTPVKACSPMLPKEANQEATKTADQGKFNDRSTTVVSRAPASITQDPGSTSGGNTAEFQKRTIAKIRAETDILSAKNDQLCPDTIKEKTVPADLIFRKMEKPIIENPESTPVPPVAYFRRADGTLGEVDFTELGNTLKEVTGAFVFKKYHAGEYHLNWGRSFSGLYDPYSIHAGQLDNGRFFLHALKPELCDRLFTLDTARQQIRYLGDDDFTPGPGEHDDHFSLYCGTTYGEAMAAFELACKGTDIANCIRPLLGWSDAVGAKMGHQPKVPGFQAEAMEMPQVVPDPYWEKMAEWDMSLF